MFALSQKAIVIPPNTIELTVSIQFLGFDETAQFALPVLVFKCLHFLSEFITFVVLMLAYFLHERLVAKRAKMARLVCLSLPHQHIIKPANAAFVNTFVPRCIIATPLQKLPPTPMHSFHSLPVVRALF